MSIEPRSCFLVVCDGGCEDPWDECTPHFETVDEAVATVRSYGWVVVGERALCPDCAAKEACNLTGHTWPDAWMDIAQRGIKLRLRHCEVCNASETDPPREQLRVLIAAADIVDGEDA
jgi:hypothetical protein